MTIWRQYYLLYLSLGYWPEKDGCGVVWYNSRDKTSPGRLMLSMGTVKPGNDAVNWDTNTMEHSLR